MLYNGGGGGGGQNAQDKLLTFLEAGTTGRSGVAHFLVSASQGHVPKGT